MPIPYRLLFPIRTFFALLPLILGCSTEAPPVPIATKPHPIPLASDNGLLEQARRQSSRGAYRQAAQLFEQLLQRNPVSISAHAGLAHASLKLGLIPQAINICTLGIAQDSTALELFNILAAVYSSDGRYGLAIQTLERALAQQPNFALAHLNIGGMHFKLGQFEQAEPHLRTARALAPRDPVVRRRLGELFLKTDRPDSALAELAVALITYPQSETLHYLVGLAYDVLNQESDALAAYIRSGNLDPSFAEVHYLTATMARRQGRPGLADSSLKAYKGLRQIAVANQVLGKQLVKLRNSILDSPEDPLHHFNLARFFADQGYHREALNRFGRVLVLNPKDYRALNHMGSILLKGKNPQAALPFFLRALNLEPDFKPALINTGNTNMLLEHYSKAGGYYAKAVELDPQLTLVWHHLAQAHLALDQHKLAQQALLSGLQTAPKNTQLSLAMKKLLAQSKEVTNKRGDSPSSR
ncbi:MAG TPA: tetratricopeptide repeat protein [Candidatus Latescibacteria bacterium]|nr:tetratricopeptide repeat protein [Candidatus Handelsmanbacteria bacterium]HIL11941.1 tetratricopeptide repeat protein [Candidatus Latescibacterota bacterium]